MNHSCGPPILPQPLLVFVWIQRILKAVLAEEDITPLKLGDLGCGFGGLTRFLERVEVLGVDNDPVCIQFAAHLSRENHHFLLLDLLSEKGIQWVLDNFASFDVVVSNPWFFKT